MTLLRVALTPVVLANIVRARHREAAIWFALAAFTDLLDGWLARSQRTTTAVGQYLDPIADKILLSGVFIALAIFGSVPKWFVALLIGRDLAILAASAIAMRFSSYNDYTPTIWGKLSTTFQILAAITVMASNAEGSGGLDKAARWTVLASTSATTWSAIHYTWRGVRHFTQRNRR